MRSYSHMECRGLPQEELHLLRNAVDIARVQAAGGRAFDGYHELRYGLTRAELLRGDGLPWAEELVRRYEAALRDYWAGFEPVTH